MRYNEKTYYRANPFYQQGYLPDISLFNRKAPECSSQIPQGDQFFTEVGRKHYNANESEIEKSHVLQCAERYPFEHRIALDKKYPRNLNTLDIEGAASSTLVSKAIKNKIRAQEDLASRKDHVPSPLDNQRQKTLQQQRKIIALRQYQESQQRKNHSIDSSRTRVSNAEVGQNKKDNNYNNSIPSGISKEFKRYVMQYSNHQFPAYNFRSMPIEQVENKNNQEVNSVYHHYSPQKHRIMQQNNIEQHQININNRYKSNPQYMNNFETIFRKRKNQQEKIQQMNDQLKNLDVKKLRRVNPTNLSSSFNAAAHQIVGI